MESVRTIVVTGASSGLGAAAARALAADGWRVAVVGRDPERTRAVAASIGSRPYLADYDRLNDVRALADDLLRDFDSIDVLANNAGGLVGHRGVTADGHERTIQHNHLAPFLLTSLLTDRFAASSGRVINTASVANRFGRLRVDNLDRAGLPYFAGWPAYCTAKLATILFTAELARRTALTAYSFHPGFVGSAFASDSLLGRAMMGLSASRQISPEQGAVPLVQLATAPLVDAPNGTYFDGLYPGGQTRRDADSPALAAALWEATVAAIGR
jgi:NAD(P)-dependent dehydrogenase (short-subunit alcohol dehydrogenase family)